MLVKPIGQRIRYKLFHGYLQWLGSVDDNTPSYGYEIYRTTPIALCIQWYRQYLRVLKSAGCLTASQYWNHHRILPAPLSKRRRRMVTGKKGIAFHNNPSKLTLNDIQEIKLALLSSIPQSVLAEKYGVSCENISHIARGKNHRKVRVDGDENAKWAVYKQSPEIRIEDTLSHEQLALEAELKRLEKHLQKVTK